MREVQLMSILCVDPDERPVYLQAEEDDGIIASGKVAQVVANLQYVWDADAEQWVRKTQPSSGGGGIALIERITVASVATSVTFSNLSLSGNTKYKIFIKWKNADASNTRYLRLQLNTETTTSNYYYRSRYGNASNVASAGSFDSIIVALGAAGTCDIEGYIWKDPDAYNIMMVRGRAGHPSQGESTMDATLKNVTVTDAITSIKLDVSVGAIAAGSVFELYSYPE